MAQTDARGNTNTADYNGVGIKVRDTDANGNSIVTRIDVLGHDTAVTDALGHTHTKFYDNLGRLGREVDATGYQTVYRYDVFDRRTSVTDGLGALTAIDGDHSTVFHYDQRDRMVQVDQAQGWHLAHDPADLYEAERIRLGYTAYRDLVDQTALDARTPVEPPLDDNGNPLPVADVPLSDSERAAAKATLQAQGINSTLDLLSAQQRTELAALYTQHASYDGRNNRTATTDANGHVTREVYDALGRVTDTITLQNGVEVHNRRAYDIYGNLIFPPGGDGRDREERLQPEHLPLHQHGSG